MNNSALVTFSGALEAGAPKNAVFKLATLWFDKLQFEISELLDSKCIGGAPTFEQWKEDRVLHEQPNLDSATVKFITSRWERYKEPTSEPNKIWDNTICEAVEKTVAQKFDDHMRKYLGDLDFEKEKGAAETLLKRR